MRGVAQGIAQIGHGKRQGLARMKPGDGFVYYSPKVSLTGTEPLRAFTALGIVTDDEIWQADEGDFKPWRRRITYKHAQDAPIRPLLDDLELTKGKVNWGYSFRYGLIEVSRHDFELIAQAMGVER